jgi:hypothetical protein
MKRVEPAVAGLAHGECGPAVEKTRGPTPEKKREVVATRWGEAGARWRWLITLVLIKTVKIGLSESRTFGFLNLIKFGHQYMSPAF